MKGQRSISIKNGLEYLTNIQEQFPEICACRPACVRKEIIKEPNLFAFIDYYKQFKINEEGINYEIQIQESGFPSAEELNYSLSKIKESNLDFQKLDSGNKQKLDSFLNSTEPEKRLFISKKPKQIEGVECWMRGLSYIDANGYHEYLTTETKFEDDSRGWLKILKNEKGSRKNPLIEIYLKNISSETHHSNENFLIMYSPKEDGLYPSKFYKICRKNKPLPEILQSFNNKEIFEFFSNLNFRNDKFDAIEPIAGIRKGEELIKRKSELEKELKKNSMPKERFYLRAEDLKNDLANIFFPSSKLEEVARIIYQSKFKK